jgi:Ca-activated chloride channel family protein
MNELDRLKDALKNRASAAPRPEAKEAAIAAALAAFDAKAERASQGTKIAGRLIGAAHAAFETVTGRRPMRMTHALAGGASLIVLALAVMTAANLQRFDSFSGRPPIGVPPVRDLTDEAKRDADQQAASETAPAPEPAPPPQPARQDFNAIAAVPAAPAESAGGTASATTPDARARPLASDQLAAKVEMDRLIASNSPGAAAGALEGAAPMPAARIASADQQPQAGYHDEGRDRFAEIKTNPLKVAAEEPVSTFSIDVDTASYSFMRASIDNGVLPQEDAVRVEELINYFPYEYPGPETREVPFKANVTVMQTPWNPATKLLHIGIKGYDIQPASRPKANLVFLIDTSGSMDEPNKLPLVINAMKLLVDTLSPDDTVAIVTYAGSAGTVLEPTKASEKGKILAALENLGAGGSTAGAEGIRQAYQLAEQNFDKGGVNRVILATDGDFNVGITDTDELQSFIERERSSGIFLSVLGFGMGNYNDELMQALAQNGNGAAAYIDTLNEARKVLVQEAGSTMFPIAKDVKIQVEFNPATVSEYRLIGYETRMLNREDFNNDKVDAGEIGSGRTVTAIYEITPKGSGAELVDSLRYQTSQAPAPAQGQSGEYAYLKIRYKLPDSDTSRLIETPISAANEVAPADGGTQAREARFAAAVAAFGQLLRGGQYTGAFGYDDVVALAQANKGEDEFGYRAEFINLARLAKSAAAMQRRQPQERAP